MTNKSQHASKISQILAEFKSIKNSKLKISTNKTTTNLFRGRKQGTTQRLSMRELNDVVSIDAKSKTAVVEGMCSYERLLQQTLALGLMPAVVPQLKTITLGGAVTGIGIESSSFKYGFPHETVTQLEILTGLGKVIQATPTNEHQDLFYGFPNSYGTLGYALSLTIKLVPTKSFVKLKYIKFTTPREYFKALKLACDKSSWEGERLDFIDGVIFGPEEMYLVLATMVANAPYTSDYTYKNIFYRSIQTRSEDYLTIKDYLWRWDTDWFWCSKSLGAQNPIIRRIYGAKRLHSGFYMKLFGLETKYHPRAKLDKLLRKPLQEPIVQDVTVPIQSAEAFLKFFNSNIGIEPIWNCPVRQLDGSKVWTLFEMKPKQLYLNFGFWDSADANPHQPDGYHNRQIESKIIKLKGRKSLYSDSFYNEDAFWTIYNQVGYDILKAKYDPSARFKDLYQKTVLKG